MERTTGKNRAPAKKDDSVLSTVTNDPSSGSVSVSAVVETTKSSDSVSAHKSDRKLKHAEMKKRGEEKQKLLRALSNSKVSTPLKSAVVNPLPVATKPSKVRIDTSLGKFEEERSVIAKRPSKKTPGVAKTINNEDKRKKMRLREKLKRQKVSEKKLSSKESMDTSKRLSPVAFGDVVDRPSDSVRQLGNQLMKKFEKHSINFRSAYDSYSKAK